MFQNRNVSCKFIIGLYVGRYVMFKKKQQKNIHVIVFTISNEIIGGSKTMR